MVEKGDKNSKFFHGSTLARKENNIVYSFLVDRGERMEGDEMAEVFLSYFRNLVGRRISDDIAVELGCDFTEDEIIVAMKQMPLGKSPSLDGMTASFYKSHWDGLGSDIFAHLLDVLNNGGDFPILCHTDLVMIPKVRKPSSPLQFRPISLSNVIYKILSKVIVNRMRSILCLLLSWPIDL